MKPNITTYVGNKIREFRRKQKITQKELGLKVGVKHNTISSYENGTNEPEQDTLFYLAKILNVSINDFFPPTDQTSINDLNLSGVSKYPYYPVPISGGLPVEIDPITADNPETIFLPDTLMGKWAGSKDIYVMRVNGDSMNQVIPHNSLIAVKNVELSSLHDSDIVVYSNGHKYSIKRFYNDKINKRIIFRPDSMNMRFTDYVVPYEESNELVIHGKVVVYIVESS